MSYIFSFDISPESTSVVFDWATWKLADSSGILNDILDLESMVLKSAHLERILSL